MYQNKIIKAFKKEGFVAEPRDWVMGKTVIVYWPDNLKQDPNHNFGYLDFGMSWYCYYRNGLWVGGNSYEEWAFETLEELVEAAKANII